MTWEEKLAACAAIGHEIGLRMRKPGDWYVEHRGVEVKEGPMLASRYGNGETPQLAVEDHWQQLTVLAPREYVVLDAGSGERRRAVRWNGFMWMDVKEAA